MQKVIYQLLFSWDFSRFDFILFSKFFLKLNSAGTWVQFIIFFKHQSLLIFIFIITILTHLIIIIRWWFWLLPIFLKYPFISIICFHLPLFRLLRNKLFILVLRFRISLWGITRRRSLRRKRRINRRRWLWWIMFISLCIFRFLWSSLCLLES